MSHCTWKLGLQYACLYFTVKTLNNMGPAAMSLLQQQIFSQYALINGLVGPAEAPPALNGAAESPLKKMKPSPAPAPPPFQQQSQPPVAGHPAMQLQEQVRHFVF